MSEPDRANGAPVWQPGAPVSSAPPLVPGSGVPGTVQAAVIVAWTSCSLVALGTVGLTVTAAWMGSIILPYFERSDRLEMVAFVLGAALASLTACAVASTCAWFVWRRHSWARVALALCSAMTLVSTTVFATLLSVLTLPASIAVLVLLFLPRSNSWFRPRPTG